MSREISGAHILVIAGEASGDNHGAELVESLKHKCVDSTFFGIGGDKMQAAGVQLVRHASQMAFLGFFEVLKHLPFIRRVFREMTALLDQKRPDLVILIDYPGFNLRFAKTVWKKGIPVFYYISPQIWAWNAGRIHNIRKYVHHMIVIFPFEEDLYQKAGVPVTFVGHPLKDSFKVTGSRTEFFKKQDLDPAKKLLGLLPGSRKQEVRSLLPEMLRAFRILKEKYPDLQCVIGQSPTLEDKLYRGFSRELPALIKGQTQNVMAFCDAVLVASGTATLETAVAGTPMVVTYKMAPLSYWIGKRLVKVDHVGLVNIVAGKRLVPELIQQDANGRKMAQTIEPYLSDNDCRNTVRTGLAEVSDRLGSSGASERAADVILEFLSRQSN